MNKITATGRIVADAEVRYTSNSDAICSFRLASDVGYGERKTTNWFSCQIWGKRGEGLAEHLTKGLPVTVFGTLTLREWENRDGAKQLSPEIRVDEITLHGQRDSSQRPTEQQPQGQQRNGYADATGRRQPQQRPPMTDNLADMDDDIPF
ncbi:single-stranded DNA-binding protein [Alcaligenes sp. YSL9]|uniref:single-stranded DNA-binding protein n=1 Tax=Alcaligenes sp. YSL9 TaxID=2939596 RepID=UPI00266CF6F7|nr:single-stranded DNA-binding protein [Alcaligenes sp. YSL9]